MLEPPRTSRGLSCKDPRRLQNGLLAQRSHPCPDGRHPPNDHRHHPASVVAAALGLTLTTAAGLVRLPAAAAPTRALQTQRCGGYANPGQNFPTCLIELDQRRAQPTRALRSVGQAPARCSEGRGANRVNPINSKKKSKGRVRVRGKLSSVSVGGN